jgi:hypothetical protein
LSKASTKFVADYLSPSPRHLLSHARNLTRLRTTLLYRPTTGHVQLRNLLRIQLIDSLQCEHSGLEPESVTHYLLRYTHFVVQI